MKQFTLRRKEMLKSRKLLEKLFREGKNMSAPPVRLHYRMEKSPAPGMPPVYVGMGAGKKYFKKAVDRNRIKRLLREAYRLQKHELVQQTHENGIQLHVFLMYVGRTLPSFDEIMEKTGLLLLKLRERLYENPS